MVRYDPQYDGDVHFLFPYRRIQDHVTYDRKSSLNKYVYIYIVYIVCNIYM